MPPIFQVGWVIDNVLIVAIYILTRYICTHTDNLQHSRSCSSKYNDRKDYDDEDSCFERRGRVRIIEAGCECNSHRSSKTRPEEHDLVGLWDFILDGVETLSPLAMPGDDVD